MLEYLLEATQGPGPGPEPGMEMVFRVIFEVSNLVEYACAAIFIWAVLKGIR